MKGGEQLADGDIFNIHWVKGWISTTRRFFEGDQKLERSAYLSTRKMFGQGEGGAFGPVVSLLVDHVMRRRAISDWGTIDRAEFDTIRLQFDDEKSRIMVDLVESQAAWLDDIVPGQDVTREDLLLLCGQRLLADVVECVATAPEAADKVLSRGGRYRMSPALIMRRQIDARDRLRATDELRRVAAEQLGIRLPKKSRESGPHGSVRVDQRALVSEPFVLDVDGSAHAAD